MRTGFQRLPDLGHRAGLTARYGCGWFCRAYLLSRQALSGIRGKPVIDSRSRDGMERPHLPLAVSTFHLTGEMAQ